MWQPNFDPNNKRLRWICCILAGIYLNIFIVLFLPYQGEIFTYTTPFYYQFVFGGIVTVVFLTTSIFLPTLFPRFFTAPHFTTTRFVLWFLASGLLIHIPSFFYDNWLIHHENTWDWFLTYEIKYAIPTLIFMSVPFLMVVTYIFSEEKTVDTPAVNEEKTIAPVQNEAEITASIVKAATVKEAATPPQYTRLQLDNFIQFTDASGKKTFDITSEQLIYIKSATNYVEIYYTLDNDVLNRTLLRQTLKKIENQLVREDNAFCRCHNEYIINKEKIVALKGNAKGYQLILKGGNKPIPVSRNKNEKLITTFFHLLDT